MAGTTPDLPSSPHERHGRRLLGVHHSLRETLAPGIGLPSDLLEQAVRRLGFLALLIGGLMVASVVSNVALHGLAGAVPLPPLSVAARLLGAAAAGAMWLAARSKTLTPVAKTHLGLGYEVVGAATILAFELTMMPEMGVPFGAVPTVALWVVIFQLVVPAARGRGLLAALLAASMTPLVTWALHGVVPFDYDQAMHPLRLVLPFGAALLAWFAAQALHQLGRALSEARMLGSYQLEERLGEGGMGEVWRGKHAMLKRPAAIKLIHPDKLGAGDPESRESTLKRFEREAQATAELCSAHTVTLYDFGVTADGTFYTVMELLDGVDLDTLVAKHGPLPPERVVFFLAQICHSLADAHERSLIHRDIKPANIFVCKRGSDLDFIKVLDFGLVKDIEHGDEGAEKLSRDGVITGTPAFMPPEMALGTAPVDERSDVYMVGCVAYWLLTGELVFSGATPVALISNHIHSVPEPVSKRAPEGVPEGLEAIVMECLAKKPSERPPGVAALQERLRSTELAASWTPDRARAWWKAHS